MELRFIAIDEAGASQRISRRPNTLHVVLILPHPSPRADYNDRGHARQPETSRGRSGLLGRGLVGAG